MSPELARQAESARLLEDKVRRAEAEAHELEMAKHKADEEKIRLEQQAQKEKMEGEASRKKMKEMEDRARKMAAEAEAKAKEVAKMQAEVSFFLCFCAICINRAVFYILPLPIHILCVTYMPPYMYIATYIHVQCTCTYYLTLVP